LIPYCTYSAELTRFNGVQERDGWIEYSGQITTSQHRIHLLPIIKGPGSNDERATIKSTNSGVLISYVIENPPPKNANQFVKDVLLSILGAPINQSIEYVINTPNPRETNVDVIHRGETLITKSYTGEASGAIIGQVQINTNDAELRSLLLRGDFQLQATFDLPVATFQSVSIKISKQQAIKSKVDALKTIVRKSATSGGKFLWWDWRNEVGKNTITQSINSQTSTSSQSNYTILSIDPDESMLHSLESILGMKDISYEQFMSNHERAAVAAESQRNSELAKLHRQYKNAASVSTPEVQAELLNKMFAVLGDDWVKIGSFIANGIQFRESSNSNTTKYIGSGVIMADFTQIMGYDYIKLTTNRVRFIKVTGPFKIFLPTITTENQAERVLLDAVANRNTHLAQHALLNGAGVNSMILPQAKTALMHAASNCDVSMVQLLLDSGANTSVIDAHSRTASSYANLAGCNDLDLVISSVPLISFNLEIVLDDPRLQLKNIILEEAGTIHPPSGPGLFITLKDTPGNKIFRLLIKALVMVDSVTYNRAPNHYNGYRLVQQYHSNNAPPIRVYEMTDVCRIDAEILDVPVFVTKYLKFDNNNHAVGLSNNRGSPPSFNHNTRFFDRERFGVGSRAEGFVRF
jgi:hypothetical protein